MILITGGLGYLGGRIAAHLLQRGYSVRLATRQANAVPPSVLSAATIVRLDLRSPETLRAAIQGVESIIHLAALNADECARDPQAAVAVNTLGTMSLLNVAQEQGVSRVIYFSTAHVYGSPLVGTIDERSMPRPAHHYSITHRAAEDYVLHANDSGRVSGTVLRLSNAVGAPVSPYANCWQLVGNNLAMQVAKTNKITLVSSGRQQRNFVAITDVAQFIEHMLASYGHPFAGQILNMGGENSLSVLQFATMVRERSRVVLGRSPTIAVDAAGDGQSHEAALDFRIDRIRALGFLPRTAITDEVDATLLMCEQLCLRRLS